MVEIVLDIVKYILPAIMVVLTTYLMMRQFIQNESKKRYHELRLESHKETLNIKLQAYERLTLLVTRMSPPNLLARIQKPNLSAQGLKQQIGQHIKTEFEHNLTQRMYVSERVWQAVQAYRSEILKITAQQLALLDKEAMGITLVEAILKEYMQDEELLTADKVIKLIKLDLKELL